VQEYQRNGWYVVGGALIAGGSAWVVAWGVAVESAQKDSGLRFWIPSSVAAIVAGALGLLVVFAVILGVPEQLRRHQDPPEERRYQLQSGEKLSAGKSLYSPNGRFRLTMQRDGNLVIYDRDGHSLWASNTAKTGRANYLMLQSDGNLVLYRRDEKPLKASGTVGQGSQDLNMQDDGNLVLYASGERPIWASGMAAGLGTWQLPSQAANRPKRQTSPRRLAVG
jgi:hypothetical protein